MSELTNAAPKIIYSGIKDNSRRPLVRGEVTFAQHTPLLRLWTETGPTETTAIGPQSDDFNRIFGEKTLARRGKYFNLQSLLAEQLLARGNPFFVKRLIPDDAPNPARLIVAIEIVADTIPLVTTALAGFDYPDAVGDTGSVSTETVSGLRARIVLIANNTAEIGTQAVLPGTLLAEEDGTQGMVYPLFEVPVRYHGEPGNRLGMRIWAPNTLDTLPFDEDVCAEFKTRLYRIQFMQRSSATSSPVVIQTPNGSDYVDVSFKEGVYSETNNKEYYIGDTLVQSHSDDGVESGLAPVYSPFERVHVYADNIQAVQEMIWLKETTVNPASLAELTEPGQIDFLTCIGIDGDRYQSVLLEGPLNGGITLGKDTVIYAQGGGDGTISHAAYEELVNIENENFGELGDEYENVPVYPFSHIYDTGLSMDGKYKLMNVLAARRDIKPIFTTYIEAEGRAPTKSEELSRLQAISTRLKAYPESMLYGTGVCRAEIILQTGELVGGGYNKPVPQLIDYAMRWADFAGVATGVLREGYDIDEDPNNRVTLVKNLNVKYFNERMQAEIWRAGGTYSISYDTRSQYYPALHSVYSDDTSVLISPITVSICCHAVRLARRVHRSLSGNTKLTKAQFRERSDRMLNQILGSVFGERVQIIPETYHTASDVQNGFSWHVRLRVLANTSPNVMYLDVETERMAEG